ncbi:hypothetical protein NC651_012846 [Populus alba x Populus x berolinensis]|nr:hypothetical protein NC651_012846 [Populus alba x Populus x berolinensis]
MVNEWNVPGCFKGMLMVRKNNLIKDMEDKGGHFIRKLDFIMMEFLAFVGSGELYTWGSNENGCLGNGYLYSLVSILKFRLVECSLLDPLISIDVLHIPERVEGPFLRSPVEKVSCGWKHTAAISEGNVFTWGWGGSHGTFSEDGLSSGGQLGHGDDFDYGNPTLVAFEKKMKALEVSCGFNHTGAILESVDA